MATTCELIAKNVLTSTATDIDFTSIPATYDDLWLLVSARTDNAGQIYGSKRIRVGNGSIDTGNNYSWRYLEGNGASATSGATSNTSFLFTGGATGATATANTFSSMELYIPNYAGSANKSMSLTMVQETNGSTAYMEAVAGIWSSGSAITHLRIYTLENFVSGTSAYLYGITKA